MEKKVKLFKIITIVLLIIAVSLISFVGVFRSKLNYKESLIPKQKYGMELEGNREFKFVLDTSSEDKNIYVDENGNYKGTVVEESDSSSSEGISLETTVDDENSEEATDDVAEALVDKLPYETKNITIKANEDDVLNQKSYEGTKNIIQKRLEASQISEYNLRLNTITGELIIEVLDNDEAEEVYTLASQQGKFELIDAQTGVVLLDNSHIKKVQASYTTNESYQAGLQIIFTDEGAELLNKISKEYVETTDEQGTTTQKKVELKIDDNTLLSACFDEELNQGILSITMGSSTTDYSVFLESYNNAVELANVLNFGKTPNKLSLSSDNFIQSQITDEQICYAKVSMVVVIAIVSIILIIKYKKDGVLAVISSIGYIAVTMLVIRYTNVTITFNSVLAIIGIMVVNYVFMFNFLKKKKTDSAKHAFLQEIKRLNVAIIPLWVVAIIFTFMIHIAISSVGMVLFWGLFLHCVYSFVITRTLYV